MTWPAFVANWIVNDYAAMLRRGATPYHTVPGRATAVTALLIAWYRRDVDSTQARRLLRSAVAGEFAFLEDLL